MPAPRRGAYHRHVTQRALVALLILLGTATVVSGKAVCSPGRFVIDTSGASAALDGRELVLGAGTVSLSGMCANAPGRRYQRGGDNWINRVAARLRCHGRSMALRARFDLNSAYCTRLEGFIRTGSRRRIAFTALRIVECGNRVREAGEQCDGHDGVRFAADCCGADCRVKPGCPVLCETTRPFPCEGADEICVTTCGFVGACQPRAEVDCGTTPVCDCALQVTYADRCAAWEAGTGVGTEGPCPEP